MNTTEAKYPDVVAQAVPSIVFEDDHVRVVFYAAASDFLLITFAPLKFTHPVNTFYAQSFVQKMGIACLGFVAKSENWYPQKSVEAAAKACQDILASYKEHVLYGQSMGGYGAVKHSRTLGADVVLAFSPQYSIKPFDVPGAEKKFQNYYNDELHHDMAIKSSDVAGRVFLFFDPFERFDFLQAEAIQRVADNITEMHAPLTGHLLVTAFADSTALHALIDGCRTSDVASLKRLVLARRKASPQRVLAIAKHIVNRNPLKSDELFESQKKNSPASDTYLFKSALAYAYFSRGDLVRAEEALSAALTINPKNVEKITLMAEIKLSQQDSESALIWAQKAIDIDKNFIRAKEILGTLTPQRAN